MNVTKLFLERDGGGELTHLGSASSRICRTSGDLRVRVGNLAAALREFGVGSGDVVLIVGLSSVEMAESILAAMNIGAAAVPFSPMLGVTHLSDVIARLAPKCCIFDDCPDPSVRRALETRGCALIPLKATAETTAYGWTPYEKIIDRHAATLAFADYEDGQPALVLHGSGSSGSLKAVAMTHGALLRFFEYHNFVYSQYSDGPGSLTGTGALITGLPLTHLAGLALCLQGLMSARRTFLMGFFLPDAFLKLVEEARCAFVMLVPSLYRSLLREPYLQQMDKSALRFCITGGEPCSFELITRIEQAFGVPVVTAYSMTECLSGIGHLRHDLFARRVKPGSCGRQIFGEVALRDAEDRQQPEFGELWVRNATVRACYLDGHLNDEKLISGWFRTGDLFYRDSDGDFFHRGRTDDMFIVNGKNIYPSEIELLLMKHPAVEIACAAPVEMPGKGPVPAVLVVARQRVSIAELQEFFMKNGASHAVPRLIRLADAIPLIGPGKIDRPAAIRLLRQAALEASLESPAPSPERHSHDRTRV